MAVKQKQLVKKYV